VPGEDQPAFDALLASVEESYQPAGPLECELARTLATLRWRIRRIPEIETAILTNELALAKPQIDLAFSEIDDAEGLGFVFQKLADSGKSLALLLRYETSLTRLYNRTLKQLADLQKLRNEPNRPSGTPDAFDKGMAETGRTIDDDGTRGAPGPAYSPGLSAGLSMGGSPGFATGLDIHSTILFGGNANSVIATQTMKKTPNRATSAIIQG